MIKKAAAALICTVAAASLLTSCGVKDGSDSSSSSSQESVAQQEIKLDRFAGITKPSIDLENSAVKNFTTPKNGDTVIIMNIKGYGEVKIRLFPEYAAKGVENFVELAKKGYYDGLTFHRVISDFMIQGGDPLGNGTGGESVWGGSFDGGTDPNVIHAAGAVAYANSGSTATNGSQFYIVTGTPVSEEDFALYEQYGYTFSDDAKAVYTTVGGTPHLDGGYTVFGQVYDGLDVIFAAQDVETDQMDKPVDDLIIESVKVSEYNGEELKWFLPDYQ
ncbi:MAG TPA: peptidylprolyl isomerase [Ruminococcus sp.]|nr:peptidylprolyl isomerase [Ruminococcus sp.]HOR22513.1 peptidylprolyl isomerase [Ruminococcus sp.]